MENELIAYGLTLLLGLISGYAGSMYTRTKKALALLSSIISDDKITAEEIKQIKNYLKETK